MKNFLSLFPICAFVFLSFGYGYCPDFGLPCDDGNAITTGDIYTEECLCEGAGFCGNGILGDELVTYTCSESEQTPACTLFQSLQSDLAAYYRFDTGDASDSSGNGFSGTPSGGVTFGPGYYTGGVTFDGVNDVVNLPNLVLNDDFAMTFWTRYTGSPTNGLGPMFLGGGNYLNGADYRGYIWYHPSTDLWRIAADGETRIDISDPGAILEDGAWHFVTISRTGHEVSVYVDGNLIGAGSHTLANDFHVRSMGWSYSSYYHEGDMDEVRIYDRALHEKEIEEIYTSSTPSYLMCIGREGDLIARYMFDGASSQDVSGHGYHGNEIGGVSFIDDVDRGSIASFDGTGEILVPSVPDATRVVDEITIGARVKLDVLLGNASTNYPIVEGGEYTNIGDGYVFRIGDRTDSLFGRIDFIVAYGGATYGGIVSTAGAFPNDQERHYVSVTVGGNTGQIYVDGYPVPMGDTTITTPIISSTPTISLGANGGQKMNGSLDDIHIYKSVLSADAIQHLYDETRNGTELCIDTLHSGLAARYNFDGNSYDSQFNYNDGIDTGVTYITDPERGQVVDFDGVDDWIEIPHSTSLNISTQATASVRVKLDTLENDFLFAKGIYPNYNYKLEHASGFFQGVFGDAGGQNITTDTQTAQTGKRYHVSQVTDGNQHRLYVDGELVATNTISGEITTNTHPLFLGRYQGGGYLLDGQLDDLRLYDRALSAHEVREVYEYTRAEPQPRLYKRSDELLAHWDFDNGTADDVSGFEHHGTPENGVSFVTDTFRGDVAQFDGIDDYITTDVEALHNTTEFSVGGWIYSNGTQTNNGASLFWIGPAGSSRGFALEPISNSIRINLGTNGFYNKLNGPLIHNKRQHVQFTYHQGTSKLYINAELVDTNTTEILDISEVQKTWIGRRGGHFQHHFDGMFDDIRLYDRALNEREIKLLYKNDGVEMCDDANTTDKDRCSNACVSEYCRDDAPLIDTTKNFVVTELTPTSIAGTSMQPDSEISVCFESETGDVEIYKTSTDASGSFSYIPDLSSYTSPWINVGVMLHDEYGRDIDHHALMMKK